MSYHRGDPYIYPSNGGVYMDGVDIPDRVLNAWLACLDHRGDEYERRKAHGYEVLAGKEEKFVLHPSTP